MRIENSNYLASLQQAKSITSTNATNSSSSSSSVSTIESQRFDILEISNDAYQTYANSLNKTSVDLSNQSNPLEAVLDGLVSDGTITSDQKDAIAAALAPKDGDSSFKMQMDKPIGPPPPPPSDSEEVTEADYLQELLQSLVDDNKISDDQKDEIENILQMPFE